MKDCWVTSNKLRNGSAGWPLRPGKVAVLTAHQWPLPRALCTDKKNYMDTHPPIINKHAEEVLQTATVEILKRCFLSEIGGMN